MATASSSRRSQSRAIAGSWLTTRQTITNSPTVNPTKYVGATVAGTVPLAAGTQYGKVAGYYRCCLRIRSGIDRRLISDLWLSQLSLRQY